MPSLVSFSHLYTCRIKIKLYICRVHSNLVENALPKIRWAGRLQKIESGKLTKVIYKYDSIFLDGFHNTDGVKVFINNLKGKNNFLICSFLINKNYKNILKLLEPYFKKIFVTPMEEENSIQVVNVNKTNKINSLKYEHCAF